MRERLRCDRGVAFMLALLFPVLVYGFTGIMYDGGLAMTAANDANDLALSTARTAGFAAGPTADGSGQVIDAGEASSRAQALLAAYPDASGSVAVAGTEVTATVTWTYLPTLFPWPGGWTYTKSVTIDTDQGTASQGD